MPKSPSNEAGGKQPRSDVSPGGNGARKTQGKANARAKLAVAAPVKKTTAVKQKKRLTKKGFVASIYGHEDLPGGFVDLIRELEDELKIPISHDALPWLISFSLGQSIQSNAQLAICQGMTQTYEI